MHELIYWAGVACALGGLYLSIDGLANTPTRRKTRKRPSESIRRFAMTAACIASMVLWGCVVYLALEQLVEWGQCI